MTTKTIPRAAASWLAGVTLVGLTLMTWRVSGHESSAYVLAGLACVKVLVIGAIFLELDRSHPRWAAMFVAYFATLLASAAWLIAG